MYELVIADLSILNPNVFYELAIRQATNLPVLLLAHKETKIPFDVRQERVVFYSLDLDDVESDRRRAHGLGYPDHLLLCELRAPLAHLVHGPFHGLVQKVVEVDHRPFTGGHPALGQ